MSPAALAKENPVPEHLDPVMIGIVFAIWPVTKSVVVLYAVVVSTWSRNEVRRRAAARILRTFAGAAESADQPPRPDQDAGA